MEKRASAQFFFLRLHFHSALVFLLPVGYGLAADGRMQEVVDGEADELRTPVYAVPTVRYQYAWLSLLENFPICLCAVKKKTPPG